MSKIKKEKSNNNVKYLLLFLLILLSGLGIWKCQNLPSELTEPETAHKQMDSLEGGDSDVKLEENIASIPEEEIKKPEKEEPSEPLETNKSDIPNVNIDQQGEAALEEESEKLSEELIVPNEVPFKKAMEVSKVNSNIDKRPPATSSLSCQSSTTLQVSKSSVQTSIAFSPDGTKFASGSHDDFLSIMNMEGKELLKLIGHKGYVQSLKYSPDGKFIVSGSMDNTAKIWDASNGKVMKNLKGHTEGILSVAYSSNGKYIATGSLDDTAILWDAKSGKQLLRLRGHQSEIAEVEFSMDSKFLMTGSSDGTAKLWDVKTGEILYSLEGHESVVGGVAFTPDNKLVLTSSSNKIRLWNVKTGKHIHTINGNKDSIMSIFISSDGQYLTSSNVNGLIKIWKIKGGEEICRLEGHSTRAREAVFHPTKENTIVSASNDKTIRIWNFSLN